MTFEKVLQAMKEGKKVKRKAWDFNYEGYCTNQDIQKELEKLTERMNHCNID